MIRKNGGICTCNVSGRTATHKNVIKDHAETHIDDVFHICHIYSISVSTRKNVQVHIADIHSEIYSCEICGKTGMYRKAYKDHKRNNHSIMSGTQ